MESRLAAEVSVVVRFSEINHDILGDHPEPGTTDSLLIVMHNHHHDLYLRYELVY
jgi:hypothetical protein